MHEKSIYLRNFILYDYRHIISKLLNLVIKKLITIKNIKVYKLRLSLKFDGPTKFNSKNL